jgi:large subunit ribosomal protein L21
MNALSAAERRSRAPVPDPSDPAGIVGGAARGSVTSACGEVLAREDVEPSREPDRCPARQEPASEMYAIVKTGGKQYKVAVGDVVDVELLDGDSVDLQPILVVDGSTVLSSVDDLAKVSITGNVLGETKGPKIKILKYKNKTGYKRRVGHRQRYSQVEITGISK